VKTITQQMKKLITINIRGEEFVVVELLHIVETIRQIIIEDLSTSNVLENDKHYYVDMI
jgi:hypothetical protein